MDSAPRRWHTLAQPLFAVVALGACETLRPLGEDAQRFHDGGLRDGSPQDGTLPRDASGDAGADGNFAYCGASSGPKCSLVYDAAPPPIDPCGSYTYSAAAGGGAVKCSPPPPACGDGSPECMQLCDDLCAVAPACGHGEADCLARCRDQLRCPGETPGMDILICESLREVLADDPIAQCSEVAHYAEGLAAEAPLCTLLARGARFEQEITSPWCPLDSSAPCLQSLAFADGQFVASEGVLEESGAFTCSGDAVLLERSLGTETWAYDVRTFALQLDGAQDRVRLVEPAFPTAPPVP